MYTMSMGVHRIIEKKEALKKVFPTNRKSYTFQFYPVFFKQLIEKSFQTTRSK